MGGSDLKKAKMRRPLILNLGRQRRIELEGDLAGDFEPVKLRTTCHSLYHAVDTLADPDRVFE